MNKPADYNWTGAPVHTATYLHEIVLSEARQAHARTILDVGCGNGQLVARLLEEGFDAMGVDGDEGGVSVARGMFPSIRFDVSLFSDTPPGTFDMVCSTEVVEHLYAPHELARYCFDSLNPGGKLVISTPYHGYLKNLVLSLAGKWDSHFTAHWHGGHIKFWSRKTLSKLLADAGFEVVRFRGTGRFPFLWKSMVLVAHRPLAHG